MEAGPSDGGAPDASISDATHAGEDDVDMDAAERAAERRLREAGLDVPERLLSREEAWMELGACVRAACRRR